MMRLSLSTKRKHNSNLEHQVKMIRLFPIMTWSLRHLLHQREIQLWLTNMEPVIVDSQTEGSESMMMTNPRMKMMKEHPQ